MGTGAAGAPGVLEAFLARSSEAVLVTDHHGRITMINPPGERLLGYELGGLVGQPVQELFPGGLPSPERPDGGPERRWREAELTVRGRRRDGSEIPLQVSVTYPDHGGGYASVVFVRPAAPEPSFEAAAGSAPPPPQEPLTGLPGVVLFMDRLSVALAGSARRSSQVALLLLDIDRFRLVNDSYGRDIGDKVLIGVAERLFGVLRPGDSLARVSEDQFAILCDDIAKAEGAATIAARAHAAVSEPYSFDGETVTVSSSLGFAVGSGQLSSPESLFRRAEEALDRAKDRGPGTLQSHDPATAATEKAEAPAPEPAAQPQAVSEPPPPEAAPQPVAAMAATEPARRASARPEPAPASTPEPPSAPTGQSRLIDALHRGEFRLAYQPIVRLQSGRIAGVEALLRWQDPERGLLGPAEFMSEAEETGLIHHIGAWVLGEVTAEAERLQTAHPDGGPLMLSINLSARQFESPDFVGVVEGILAGSRIDPGTLYMEIGESNVMEDTDAAAAVLSELRKVGVRVSIDDFGTGYSSLMHLNRFPIDFLKIDRSFIDGLDRDPSAGNIVTAVISMAHALGLPAIAEGVETAEQLYTLRRLGCDYAQGYLFARPQLLPETLSLLASDPTW